MASVRVLVATADQNTRERIAQILELTEGVHLAGLCDSAKGLAQAGKKGQFDVLLLDLEMPDGFDSWFDTMVHQPRPTIGLTGQGGSSLRDSFLRAGGLRVVMGELSEMLGTEIVLSAEIKVVSPRKKAIAAPRQSSASSKPPKSKIPLFGKAFPLPEDSLSSSGFEALVIGASTGGPQVLLSLLKGWAGKLPVPTLIVQHIVAGGFVEGLIDWLRRDSGVPIVLAREGEALQPGVTYFAPDGSHLVLQRYRERLVSSLRSEPSHTSFRPSVDVLFQSAADVLGDACLGMLLTGMGRDGALGLKSLRLAGARTFAQDQESCLVYGMPGEAVKLGAVEKQLTPSGLCREVTECFRSR